MTALLETTNNWSINVDNGVLNGVVYIDLKKVFETIDHAILLRKLANYGLDLGSLRFFASYLGNRSQKFYVNGVLSSASELRCGVPQGSILGPLFFLIYINDLPNCLNSACAKMFADDTTITISGSSLADLEQETNLELLNLHCWLKANKLSLNVAKTEFTVIGSRQKLLAEGHNEIDIKLEDQVNSNVDHAKSLGLIIDNRLSFDYCSLVWDGLSDQLSDKLQKLQNRAARVILKANYGTSSSLLLDILKWDKLVIRRKKHKAIMMFKSLNEQAPVYLQNLFHERSTDYDLRNSFHKLTLPRPRTNYLKRSFSYSGALLWNSLPENVREIKSVRKFKEQINHLFESSDSHSAVL